MNKLNNNIQLIKLSQEHTIAFKEEMQEAFQHGFQSYSRKNEEDQFSPTCRDYVVAGNFLFHGREVLFV